MKHNIKISLLIIMIFLASQYMGIFILDRYIGENGEFNELPFGVERPEVEESVSFIYIAIGVIIGTVLLLILIRFRGVNIWKTWFFLSIMLCLTAALAAFLDEKIALIAAIILALWKVFKPNVYVHNATEIFIYGGLAAIFAPIINLWSAIILLIIISIYDMIAVWKIKHMITLAKFQTNAKVFAGILIPYKREEKTKGNKGIAVKGKAKGRFDVKKTKGVAAKYADTSDDSGSANAVLGGGDMAFPLLFTGAVIKTFGVVPALVIPLTAGAALFLLLYYSQKGKFYPAMPFISAGCFIGLGIAYLLI